MRHLYLFVALSSLLVLGACSSSEALTGPGSETGSQAALMDGGADGGSNNGQCTRPPC
jgi:hypothetical protein